MNERDSETIAGLLEQMGFAGTADYNDADIIVINTCSVRENADNRFFGQLGWIKHVKTRRPETIVAVCGCMMQQEHIVEQIREKHAWVDLVFGTFNIAGLPGMIEELERSRAPEPAVSILRERLSIEEDLPVRRALPFKGSVNIMYGCNNFCTYCIVPFTRGREVSRDSESILAEVRDIVAGGAKEILLLGQNVNSYAGASNPGAGSPAVDFADLLEMVDAVPGVERIRFTTSHPKDLSSKLIDSFRPAEEGGLKRLCPSIHLPVQAGSTRVLERMNRRYTKEGYISLVEKIRAARPDIVVTTDFIVGFPGETEEDFEDTMDVIERVRFDAAFTFLYSPRKGTPAAGYDDPFPEWAKKNRFERMVGRLNEITLEKNRAYMDSVQDVLVEGRSKTDFSMLSGRTFGGKLVNFKAPGNGRAESLTGAVLPVRIVSVKTFSFIGEAIGEAFER